MVTTKRQIRRDSDRFGGFYTAEAGDISRISDYNGISDLEPITNSAPVGNSMLVSDDAPVYTAPTAAAAPTPAPVYVPERPAKPAQPRSKEDLLPTVKTRKYATEKPTQDIEQTIEKAPAKRNRASLDTKTKVLLCVYIAIALVLAIAVIATGISISGTAAAADKVATSVAQKQSVIAQQQQELNALQDPDAIRGKAAEKGMVPAGEPAFSVGNVESVGYPEATPRTDGWDEFFDWVSKVVG